MSFQITAPKVVSSESTYAGSIIAAKSFSITIKAYTSTGTFNQAYYGTGYVYANSASSDLGYQLTSVMFNAGTATVTLTINSVIDRGAFRKITVTDNNTNQGSINVGVWFETVMTVECLSLYSTTKVACGQLYTTKQKFAALPYRMCEPSPPSVIIRSNKNGKTITVPVLDVGPKVINNNYWNGTGIAQYPERGIDGSDGTWDGLGLSYSCTTPVYGSETVQWRFS